MTLPFLHVGQSVIGAREVARAGIGACLGIVLAGLLCTWVTGTPAATPLLIPPMGASAALLFGVPASPFAQPWPVLAGHLLAAAIGVTCVRLFPSPIFAAGLAAGLTLAAMMACRCVHPPSGAVALVAVLGGPHVAALGYRFVAVPVLLNTVLLLAAAAAYNNLTGRSYPHRALPPATPHPPRGPVRLTRSDFEAAIAGYGEPLAIGADDLERLFADCRGGRIGREKHCHDAHYSRLSLRCSHHSGSIALCRWLHHQG